jgi:hypothetical protein
MSSFLDNLKANKTKVAFFSSTPQGGGVALMRHALIRFAHTMGADVTWYGKFEDTSPCQTQTIPALMLW